MIQSKPFTPPFSLGPVSPASSASVGPPPLLSSLSDVGPGLSKTSNLGTVQHPPFGRQSSALFSSLNRGDPEASQLSYPSLTGNQADISDTSTQSSTSSVNPPRTSIPASSSFFPSNSFPFSANSHGSINSISNSSASTNSINSSISSNAYAKNSSIPSITPSQHVSPPPGTSNFFPSPMDDTANYTPLRVSNLPRDIKEQEFNVLFTFAPEFVFSEIQKAQSIAEDGLPTSVVGIGYFKSLPAAANALTVLTSNPHVFAPKDLLAQSNNLVQSAYAIKCEIPYKRYQDVPRIPGFNGAPGQTSQVPTSQPSQAGLFKSSRFAFPSVVSTSGTGSLMNSQLDIPPPPPNFSELYSESGLSNGVFSPSSPGSLFPGATDSEYNTRMTGKSLLLESQGKEDEEYNDLVKDPMGWLSKNESGYTAGSNAAGPVGFQPHQVHTALSSSAVQPARSQPQQPTPSSAQVPPKSQHTSQASSRAQSPPSSSNSSVSSHVQPAHTGKTNTRSNSGVTTVPSAASSNVTPSSNAWTDKRRNSTTRSFQNLSISGNSASTDGSKVVVPYSPTNGGTAIHIMQNGGRVLPPANPADQNPPCNTLYVGNLPPDTNEEELKELFSSRRGYKRLCFRTKANGPMCFVEFDDVSWATRALEELYGFGLSNSVKGGIRLSFSKNPLGVRSQANGNSSNNANNSSSSNNHHHSHSRMGSQQMPVGVSGYSTNPRVGNYSMNNDGNHQRQQQMNYNDAGASVASGYLTSK